DPMAASEWWCMDDHRRAAAGVVSMAMGRAIFDRSSPPARCWYAKPRAGGGYLCDLGAHLHAGALAAGRAAGRTIGCVYRPRDGVLSVPLRGHGRRAPGGDLR